ncbi:unnamed protein product [Acanthoscelides obtectus]|uniref:Uncharacterized protein n=1 Tax=Acanthoscelides obtectus TaxID=200917 RepID=A0A9P0P5W3_ACAOB|nr:unnamed protein product [Acanthoscelides obtectus]CAK1631142.1 hypothetical protein AOBTE_LOCUS6778 [Acanthoscelides obtectus]
MSRIHTREAYPWKHKVKVEGFASEQKVEAYPCFHTREDILQEEVKG